MKKHSEDQPDWEDQRKKIIGLGESSLRKSYYPELREKMAELEKKNEQLRAAYEELTAGEEELRQNFDELSERERELRESEEKYRNLIEHTFDGVVIHRNRKIVFANQTAAQLLGYADPAEMLGISIFDIAHPEYRQIVSERAKNALESSQYPLHEQFLHREGIPLDVEVVATPIVWEGAAAVQVAFRDITAQRQAEEALKESEQRYRMLVETTDTGFVIIDTEGRVVDANDKYVRMTGRRELAEILGKSVVEWTAEYDKEKNERAVRQCGEEGFLRNFEIDYADPAGAITPIEINATVVPYGNTSRILTLCRDISNRRKTERALRESEAFYRAIFDTTGSASVIYGSDTTIIRANEGFAQLSGYPIAELEGKHRWTEFVAEDELARMRQYHDARSRDPGSAPAIYEFQFVDRAGTVRYCIDYVSMIPGTDRRIASIVDISGRVLAEQELEKKNRELHGTYEELAQNEEELRQNYEELSARERQLRESEHRNATLLHAIPDMMFVISRDGVYRDFSVPDSHVLAVPVDRILGRNIRDSGFEEEAAETMLHHIRQALDTRELQQFEYELALPQGKRQYEARLVALREDEVLGIVRDITEQRKAERELQRNYNELMRTEQELRSAKTQLEAIYQGSPDLIFLHAPDGRILDVNENAIRAFGFATKEELFLAKPEDTSGAGYTMAMVIGHIRTALEKGEAEFLWVSRRKTGEEFPVEVRLRRIESVNERGETEPRVLAIVRDITEQRMAEKALEQARKKLGLLNTVIFQDIQSTVFALSAYLQLANSNREEAKAKSYAEKEAFLIHKIVSSLNFAKNYQDMGIHPPRWQNTNQVFLYAISHLDSLKIARDIRVGGLEMYADPLLEKVFFNLVENVFLHGQQATEISLTYQETDGGLLLVLADNGVGIPAEEKNRIFERGYGKNTGLGLFLVREILSITGISIRENGVEGKGARFEMLVPKGSYRIADLK